MALSPRQPRVLREIAEHLAASDPSLARALTGPPPPPTSTTRDLAAIAVVLHWTALAIVPLVLGVAYSHPILIGVGVLTVFIGAPVMIWATLKWVRHHRFSRRHENGEKKW